MGARTAQWMAGGVAACSIALMAGGMILAYVDRHVPAGLANWDFTAIFTDVGVTIERSRQGSRKG